MKVNAEKIEPSEISHESLHIFDIVVFDIVAGNEELLQRILHQINITAKEYILKISPQKSFW